MTWLQKIFKWIGTIINPVGASLGSSLNGQIGSQASGYSPDRTVEESPDNYRYGTDIFGRIGKWIDEKWKDWTGQTQIDQQFERNKELAQFQTQMQEELYNKYSSPEALMKQYEAAGLNPNLIYGSAGSGQGNVPSYNSPNAPLNLSYSDKFNRALALMSNTLQAKNLVYSTVANREAAEQSYLKTLRENEALKKERRENLLEGMIKGYTGGGQLYGKRYSRKGEVLIGDTAFSRYADAARQKYFNEVLGSIYQNAYLYGHYSDPDRNDLNFSLSDKWMPSAYWDNRNKEYAAGLRGFDLDWNKEYKTMLKGAGVAAPIIQTLLRILGGK